MFHKFKQFLEDRSREPNRSESQTVDFHNAMAAQARMQMSTTSSMVFMSGGFFPTTESMPIVSDQNEKDVEKYRNTSEASSDCLDTMYGKAYEHSK